MGLWGPKRGVTMSKETKNRPVSCTEDQRNRGALHDRDSSPNATGPSDSRGGRQPKAYREHLLSNLHYRNPASGPGSRSVLSVHFRTTQAKRVPLIPEPVLSIRIQEFYRDMAWDDRVGRLTVFLRFRAFFFRLAGWVKSRFFPFYRETGTVYRAGANERSGRVR